MAEISEKKLSRLKAAAHRGLGHARKQGYMETGLALGGGALVDVVLNKVGGSIPFVKDKWWGPGVAAGVAGHFLRKKRPSVGFAMLGAAGAMLSSGYRAQSGGGGSTAKGIDDVGALIDGVQSSMAQLAQTAQALQGAVGQLQAAGLDAGAIMGAGSEAAAYEEASGDYDAGDEAGAWGDQF